MKNGKEGDVSQQTETVNIWMLHASLHLSPVYPLPDGYSLRFYKSSDISV